MDLSQTDALLACIRETPDDDTPRLIYADWLDEHGEAARADFIRLQCQAFDPEDLTDSQLAELRRRFGARLYYSGE